MAGGVLVGFPRTEAGARAAALNIDAALGSELMYSQGSRHALLQAIAVPDALPAVQAVGDATYTAGLNATLKLDAAGQPIQDGLKFVARRVPVGSMVAGWTPDSAVVQVWTVGLNGLAGQGSTTPVREGWETDTVTLRWAAGDWRYISETGVPGPVPVVGAQAPSDSAALAAAASPGLARRLTRAGRNVSLVGSAVLLVLGLALVTGSYGAAAGWFARLLPSTAV